MGNFGMMCRRAEFALREVFPAKQRAKMRIGARRFVSEFASGWRSQSMVDFAVMCRRVSFWVASVLRFLSLKINLLFFLRKILPNGKRILGNFACWWRSRGMGDFDAIW